MPTRSADQRQAHELRGLLSLNWQPALHFAQALPLLQERAIPVPYAQPYAIWQREADARPGKVLVCLAHIMEADGQELARYKLVMHQPEP